jgi:hypothetical protein
MAFGHMIFYFLYTFYLSLDVFFANHNLLPGCFLTCHFGKKHITCQVLVAHTCNPSYSEGRDQEDQVWKPAPGK